MMPTFIWEAPNIHPIPGAEWMRRMRMYIVCPFGEDKDDKCPQKHRWQRHTTEWEIGAQPAGKQETWPHRLPSSIGIVFYETLKKLGYRKDMTGDYR